MDAGLASLLGGLLGALIGGVSSYMASRRHERAEHKRWLRERKQESYANAILALSKATFIPTNPEKLEQWFGDLAEVRQYMIILRVFCSPRIKDELVLLSDNLFDVIDDINPTTFFPLVTGTESISQGKEQAEEWAKLARAKEHIADAIQKITEYSRIDLEKVTKF